MDQGEDVGVILREQPLQMVPVAGPAGFLRIDCADADVGVVDLLLQLLAVGDDQEGEVAGQLATDFFREEHHRVGFAAALGVPEHAQLARQALPVPHRLHRPVDAQELVVAGDDLHGLAAAVVEEQKVLEDVHEVGFAAQAIERSFEIHNARLIFGQALPLVEVRVLAGQRAEAARWPLLNRMNAL